MRLRGRRKEEEVRGRKKAKRRRRRAIRSREHFGFFSRLLLSFSLSFSFFAHIRPTSGGARPFRGEMRGIRDREGEESEKERWEKIEIEREGRASTTFDDDDAGRATSISILFLSPYLVLVQQQRPVDQRAGQLAQRHGAVGGLRRRREGVGRGLREREEVFFH